MSEGPTCDFLSHRLYTILYANAYQNKAGQPHNQSSGHQRGAPVTLAGIPITLAGAPITPSAAKVTPLPDPIVAHGTLVMLTGPAVTIACAPVSLAGTPMAYVFLCFPSLFFPFSFMFSSASVGFHWNIFQWNFPQVFGA